MKINIPIEDGSTFLLKDHGIFVIAYIGNYSIYKHHPHRCFGTYRINCFSDDTHNNYNRLYIGCKQLYQDEFAQAFRAIYIAYPDLEAQLPIPLDELLSINQYKYEFNNQVAAKI